MNSEAAKYDQMIIDENGHEKIDLMKDFTQWSGLVIKGDIKNRRTAQKVHDAKGRVGAFEKKVVTAAGEQPFGYLCATIDMPLRTRVEMQVFNGESVFMVTRDRGVIGRDCDRPVDGKHIREDQNGHAIEESVTLDAAEAIVLFNKITGGQFKVKNMSKEFAIDIQNMPKEIRMHLYDKDRNITIEPSSFTDMKTTAKELLAEEMER